MKHWRLTIVAAVVLAGIQLSISTKPALAQDSCSNGQRWQFSLGQIGQVNPHPPLPNNVRDAPGGTIVSQIEAGELFRVIGGPHCTSNGLTWWEITFEKTDGNNTRTVNGWTAQGEGNEYWLIPFEYEPVRARNFLTRIEVGMGSVPSVSASSQLRAPIWGGGASISAPYFFTYTDWGEVILSGYHAFGEDVEVTVFDPEGDVYSQRRYTVEESDFFPDGSVGTMWTPEPADLAGEWWVIIEGENGVNLNVNTFLVPASVPEFKGLCEGRTRVLLLDGFRRNEDVTILLVENPRVHDPIDTPVLMTWGVAVDRNGQLLVEFSDAIPTRVNGDLQVSDSRGNLVGVWSYHNSGTEGDEVVPLRCEN
jgi:hypothetical protein